MYFGGLSVTFHATLRNALLGKPLLKPPPFPTAQVNRPKGERTKSWYLGVFGDWIASKRAKGA